MEFSQPSNRPSPLQDSAKQTVSILLDVIEAHGVKDVICSPGSRNAPLLMAARARKNLTKHVAVDERSAAFMALGLAMTERRPAALICTSGTAVLNYAPAVAEAYYQGIPLIVISADRPTEWIDQDDSQTIRQFDVLRNIVKGSYDVSDRDMADKNGWYENRIANDAMLTALRPKQGPVHINVRLSPPLDALKAHAVNDSSPRIINEVMNATLPDKAAIKRLARRLINRKVLLTLGFMLPDSRLNKAILKFRTHENVAVMAETISNTHLPQEDYAVDSMLCMLNEKQLSTIVPDIVISVGGALVSRMLKDFIRNSAATGKIEHWSIGPSHTTVDCFQTLTMRIDADPALFISALSAEMAHIRRLQESGEYIQLSDEESENPMAAKIAKAYADSMHSHKKIAMQRVFKFAGDAPWSELQAFIDILNTLPEDCNLFLSNGTAVRYAQIIPHGLPHASYCNRGVSGIEGSTSTAVGGAMAYSGKTLLLTGDMSLCHDLGGLLLARNFDPRLKIIVINNRGGGIFRFISSTSKLPDRDEYFCADPDIPISSLAETFGFAYESADSLESLRGKLDTFYSLPGRAILEVIVPPNKSALLLKQFLKR